MSCVPNNSTSFLMDLDGLITSKTSINSTIYKQDAADQTCKICKEDLSVMWSSEKECQDNRHKTMKSSNTMWLPKTISMRDTWLYNSFWKDAWSDVAAQHGGSLCTGEIIEGIKSGSVHSQLPLIDTVTMTPARKSNKHSKERSLRSSSCTETTTRVLKNEGM